MKLSGFEVEERQTSGVFVYFGHKAESLFRCLNNTVQTADGRRRAFIVCE